MEMNGLKWSVDQALVVDVNSFQSNDGETLAYVKLEYWGGSQTIMMDPVEAEQFRKLTGKMVKAGGSLAVEVKKGTGQQKVKFGIAVVEELKKK